MSQKSQPMLTETQQGKLHQLQLEVESLWLQVQDQTNLNSSLQTEVEIEPATVPQNSQLSSVSWQSS